MTLSTGDPTNISGCQFIVGFFRSFLGRNCSCVLWCCPCGSQSATGSVWSDRSHASRDKLKLFLKSAAHGAEPSEDDLDELIKFVHSGDDKAFSAMVLAITERSSGAGWDPRGGPPTSPDG